MSDKTEKPTQKRLDKARKDGQYAVSRSLVGAVQFLVFLIALDAWGRNWWEDMQATAAGVFRLAFRQDEPATHFLSVATTLFTRAILPLCAAGAVVFVAPLFLHLCLTRFGFSIKPLKPTAGKLNPFQKLLRLPKQNAAAVLQSLGILLFCGAAAWGLAAAKAEQLYTLPLGALDSAREAIFASCSDLLWDGALALAVVGAVDFVWQRFRFAKQMRMSKQEVRDEYREAEGNPESKARLRRLRRDRLRRRMMRRVPEATAVVVNPTHYAVALKYDSAAGAAPMVLAKGKNYLALRIRTLAETHRVPVVENPPLARALYEAVPVGGEIPSNLYRAVAELLAYVYRRVGVTG